MKLNQKKILFFSLAFLMIGIFLVPHLALAQASLGLEVPAATGLGTVGLPELVVRIVQILLGFLGIIAVIVMLYGGYVWLTAGGNADKISTAKRILINGTIGLVIILTAFAIVTFVINQLIGVTGPESLACEPIGATQGCSTIGNCLRERQCLDNGQGVGVWGSCYITNYPCDQNYNPSSNFYPQSIQPQGALTIKNVVVQVAFNKSVEPGSVINPPSGFPQSIRVLKETSDGNYEETAGTLALATNQLVTFTPATPCPAPNTNIYCLEANTTYKVQVSSDPNISIKSTTGQTVNCGFGICEAEFVTGNLVDLTAPAVNLTEVIALVGQPTTSLYNGVALSTNAEYDLHALATDDAGITQVDFNLEGGLLGFANPTPPPPLSFDANINWSTNSYQTQTYTLQAKAYDAAFHNTLSAPITVVIWPEHCFNNLLDASLGETGVDCGGTCPACEGNLCGELSVTGQCINPNNNACLSGLCNASTCYCVPLPVITNVDPNNGAPGNWVTILGEHFGTTEGEVRFTDSSGNIHTAILPRNIVACDNVWQDEQIIVEVPNSPLGISQWQVITAQNLPSNLYENFVVNDMERPSICVVDPAQGLFESSFRVIGTQFGTPASTREVYFGQPDSGITALEPFTWLNLVDHDEVVARVPNLSAGQTAVRVKVDGESSNGLYFTVLEQAPALVSISYFEPTTGPPGQYVTIHGQGFGPIKTSNSFVRFVANNANGYVEGSFDFPPSCGTNYWSDNQIIVKVPEIPLPEVISGGAPIIVVASGQPATSSTNFLYDASLSPTPGICSINPNTGAPGTLVEIAGEPFTGATVNFSNVTHLSPLPGSTNNLIKINVPSQANSGNVVVVNNGLFSNPVNFEVTGAGGPGGAAVSDYYEWQFTTCWDCLAPEVMESGNCWSGMSASPVPTKYPLYNNNQAFINQNVGVRFNVDMANNTFNTASTFKLQSCGTGAMYGACGSYLTWPGTFSFTDSAPEYVTFNPDNNFIQDTWYKITLTTGLTSTYISPITGFEENIPLAEDYVWYFKTRVSSDLCTADTVWLNPFDRTEGSTLGPVPRYQTVPYNSAGGNSGNCAICEDTFNWGWSSVNHPEEAILVDQDEPNNSHNWVYASGLVEQPEEAQISAAITDVPPNPVGSATLNIVPPNPQVVLDYSCTNSNRSPTPWPSEENICVNDIIYARFNVPIMASTLNTDNVKVYRCENGSCNVAVPEDNNQIVPIGATSATEFIFTPQSDLLPPNTWYEVSLSENILSTDGVNLTGLLTWQFKTDDDANWCTFYNVSVNPSLNNIEVGESYNYTAIGYDSFTCQLLKVLSTTTWNWYSILNRDDLPPFTVSTGNGIATVNPTFNTGSFGQTVATGQTAGLTYLRAGVNSAIYNSGYNGQLTVGIPPQLIMTSHQPTGDNVCLNALARSQFNVGLDEEAINNPLNFTLNKKVGATWQQISALVTHNSARTSISIRPAAAPYLWEADQEYMVSVYGGQNGITAGELRLNQSGCSAVWGGLHCFWTFTTVDEMCTVDHIGIEPTSMTNYIGDEQVWQATAYDEFGAALSNPFLSDNWSLTNPAVASLIVTPPDQATSESLMAGETWLNAQTGGKTGSAYLSVVPILTGPSVINTTPNAWAEEVCRNTAVSVDFDKYLNSDTVNDNNFNISYHTASLPVVSDTILNFDGDNDFVSLPAADATDFNFGTDSFLVEAWLKTTDNEGVVINKWGTSGWWFGVGNTSRAYAELKAAGSDVTFYSNTAINNDSWHHLILLVNRGNDTAKIYLDGTGDSVAADIAEVGSLNNDNNFSLGAHSDGTVPFAGSLGSVRLYKFSGAVPAAIDSLIQWQAQHPLAVNNELETSLLARWEMNENSGQVVGDFSFYEHDLAPNSSDNMPEWSTSILPTFGACEPIVAFVQPIQKNNNIILNTFLARFFNDLIVDLFNPLYNLIFSRVYAEPPPPPPPEFVIPTSGFWCTLENFGSWALSNINEEGKVSFQLTSALPPTATLRVKIKGGADGVKAIDNDLPLVNPNPGDDYLYYFTTRGDICELDFVSVTTDPMTQVKDWTFTTSHDETGDNTWDTLAFNTENDYDKVYQVAGYTSFGEELQAIVDVYDWEWYWQSSDTSVALPADCSAYPDYYPLNCVYDNDYKVVLAANKNGIADITASAVFPEWYSQPDLTDSGQAIVELCENPWPSYSQNENLRYYDEDYYFALSYCRDSGSLGLADDLPSLSTSYQSSPLVEPDTWVITDSSADPYDSIQDDLLKEYLIPVPTADDIIGLRVYSNYYHLSPLEWYSKNIPQGQQGSPSTLMVGGYPAVQDGRTVYVAATTVDGINQYGEIGEAWTNIFLISYNSGASPITENIFNQLVERWEFNTNVEEAATKLAIKNDLTRMSDLSSLEDNLYEYSLSHQSPELLNNDFEEGIESWEIEGEPDVTITATTSPAFVWHGSKSLYIDAESLNKGIKQEVNLQPNTNYDMSVWVYVVSGRVQLTFDGTDHNSWNSPSGFTGWVKLENILDTEIDPPNNIIKIYSYLGAAQFYVDSLIIRNHYPELAGGTFVYGMSTSKWPSWNETLSPALGGNLPFDPINDFNACVACEANLQNGGFEDWLNNLPDHWATFGPAQVSVNEDDNYIKAGDKSLLIIDDLNDPVGGVEQSVNLGEDAVYNLTAWVYLVSGQAKLSYGTQEALTLGTAGWQPLQLIINTQNAPLSGDISLLTNDVDDDKFYVDDVSIVPQEPNCGYSPETCWNPLANNAQGAFACDAASYFYRYQYQAQANGTPNYFLSAKMEIPYQDIDGDGTAGDVDDIISVWQPGNQNGYIFFNADHLHLSTALVEGCDNSVIGQECGNGVVEPPTEECEPGQYHNWCEVGYGWITPQLLGCQSVGHQTSGLLDECTWIEPTGTYPDYCGGYCGNGQIDSGEGCDVSVLPPTITNQGFGGGSSLTDQYACSVACQDTGGYCSDGTIQTNFGEQCDFSGGTAIVGAWECPGGATPSCYSATNPNRCHVYCSGGGTPYLGSCGNNVIEGTEVCDGTATPPHTTCNSCTSISCNTGWIACDGSTSDADGCEIHTSADPYHCNSCTNNCYDAVVYIPNPSFENGATLIGNLPCWSNYFNTFGYSTATLNNNTTYIKDGSYSVHVIADVANKGIHTALVYSENGCQVTNSSGYVYLEPMTNYTVSSWVYLISGRVTLGINLNGILTSITSPENQTGWYNLSKSFTTGGTLPNPVNTYVDFQAFAGPAEFYVDDVIITPDVILDNTIVACQAGACAYGCNPYSNYLNCDLTPSDCETNIMTNPEYCGSCYPPNNDCDYGLTRIDNGSFETGNLSPWVATTLAPSTLAISTQHVHDGAFSAHVVATATAGGQGVYQPVIYEPNTTYDLSAWVYIVSGRAALTFWGTDLLPEDEWISPENPTPGWYKLENRLATTNNAWGANGYGNGIDDGAGLSIYSSGGGAEFYVDEISHSGPDETAVTCSGGDCNYTCIQPPWTDCGGDNACESNLQTSVTDCGQCDNVCPQPSEHGHAICNNGVCGMACDGSEGYKLVGGACILACGDGIVDSGAPFNEECDGSNLNNQSCTTLGLSYVGGTLSCNSSCTFDASYCCSSNTFDVMLNADNEYTELWINGTQIVTASYPPYHNEWGTPDSLTFNAITDVNTIAVKGEDTGSLVGIIGTFNCGGSQFGVTTKVDGDWRCTGDGDELTYNSKQWYEAGFDANGAGWPTDVVNSDTGAAWGCDTVGCCGTNLCIYTVCEWPNSTNPDCRWGAQIPTAQPIWAYCSDNLDCSSGYCDMVNHMCKYSDSGSLDNNIWCRLEFVF